MPQEHPFSRPREVTVADVFGETKRSSCSLKGVHELLGCHVAQDFSGWDSGKRTTTNHNSRVSHGMLRIDSAVEAVLLCGV